MIRITLPWGTRIERERRNRIRVAVYAYAYEFEDSALVPDAEYDVLARSIDPSVITGHLLLDQFFRNHYTPDSGMWVRLHPELPAVADCYHRYYVYQG